MNFESYLMETLKEQFEDMMIALEQVKEDNIDSLYRDSNGKYFDTDSEFIRAHRKKIFTEEMMDAVYTFITQISLLEEQDLTRLIAYLSSQYYINHYDVDKDKSVLSYLSKVDIKDIVTLFFENECFGRDLVSSFYRNALNPKGFYENKEKIREDGKVADLDRLYNIAFPEEIFTLNQKLRQIICNLYNHYINRGYSDQEALEITWCYFTLNVDPLHELEEFGYEEEQIPYMKKYMLGLIIGDLYEDTANQPLVKTDNYAGRIAQIMPVLMTTIGRFQIPQDPVVRGRMLKYFILLQDNPDKMKSNREKTHAEGREMVLKKVNPFYVLDELTF